jgi:hypothetical protein
MSIPTVSEVREALAGGFAVDMGGEKRLLDLLARLDPDTQVIVDRDLYDALLAVKDKATTVYALYWGTGRLSPGVVNDLGHVCGKADAVLQRKP